MDFELTDALREAIYAHAGAVQPQECCGLVVRVEDWDQDGDVLRYRACSNILPGQGDRFRIDPVDYAAAEEEGDILAVVHSHPNASANPSMADRLGCERSGLPWLIMGWPSGVVKSIEPEGWQAPYVGREFCHGVLDCYTIIQDWFWRELSIELPDFERDDDWWVDQPDRPARDLYMDGFEQAGFVRVHGMPQRHDVLVMNIRSRKANHGAIYLGSGVMLHHLYKRPSEETVYLGDYYERHTMAVLRHRSLVGVAVAALKAAA